MTLPPQLLPISCYSRYTIRVSIFGIVIGELANYATHGDWCISFDSSEMVDLYFLVVIKWVSINMDCVSQYHEFSTHIGPLHYQEIHWTYRKVHVVDFSLNETSWSDLHKTHGCSQIEVMVTCWMKNR